MTTHYSGNGWPPEELPTTDYDRLVTGVLTSIQEELPTGYEVFWTGKDTNIPVLWIRNQDASYFGCVRIPSETPDVLEFVNHSGLDHHGVALSRSKNYIHASRANLATPTAIPDIIEVVKRALPLKCRS